MAFEGDIIIYAAIIGLLLGIIWSLRYIVAIDKKIDQLLEKKPRTASKKATKKRR